MQQSIVSIIVFLYIFISSALLIFNLLYMLGASAKNRITERKVKAEMERQANMIEHRDESAGKRQERRLRRRIRDVDGLMVFERALERNREKYPNEDIVEYLKSCRLAIFDAAATYRKRPSMERAMFAYLISVLPREAAAQYRNLGELLLSYLDRSTIYCRENVLKALCRLGNEDALEQALRLLQENGWYHNPKLISDGMAEFCGDREKLARRLWPQKWNDVMRTTLIQFMNQLPEDLSQLVLPELSSRQHETCFAAIRYFARHVEEKAGPLLRDIVRKDEDTAAVAARALRSYPGEETKQTLIKALRSRNWYVRQNAAASLVDMDLSQKEIKALCSDEDRYAREMFIYVLESRGKLKC